MFYIIHSQDFLLQDLYVKLCLEKEKIVDIFNYAKKGLSLAEILKLVNIA